MVWVFSSAYSTVLHVLTAWVVFIVCWCASERALCLEEELVFPPRNACIIRSPLSWQPNLIFKGAEISSVLETSVCDSHTHTHTHTHTQTDRQTDTHTDTHRHTHSHTHTHTHTHTHIHTRTHTLTSREGTYEPLSQHSWMSMYSSLGLWTLKTPVDYKIHLFSCIRGQKIKNRNN